MSEELPDRACVGNHQFFFFLGGGECYDDLTYKLNLLLHAPSATLGSLNKHSETKEVEEPELSKPHALT